MPTPATGASPWFPLVVLLFALVPLGANSLPALNIVLLIVSVGFLAHAGVLAARDGLASSTETLLGGTDPLWLVALPVYVAVQLVINLVAPGHGPVFEISQSTGTLTALALFYLLVRAAVIDNRSLRIVLGGLAAVGAIEALYGVLNLLGGNERLLIWQRWIFLDSATGTLSSRNHFAYLMELFLPVAIVFAVLFGRAGEHARDGGGTPVERTARTALIATVALVCGLALFFSHSRMGILSFAAACATVFVLDRTLRPVKGGEAASEGRAWPAAAVAFGAVGLVLAGAIGLDSVLERFLRLENDFVYGRWPIWQAALAMFAEKPIFGQGWGTFESLLPAYRSAPTGFFYTHAHNDYFEVLAEGGLVGLVLTIGLIVLFGRRLVETLARPLTVSQRTVIFWLGVAVTSALLHSAADYGLRIPGVAFTFVAVAAVFSRVSEEPELVSARRRRHRHRSSRSRALASGAPA